MSEGKTEIKIEDPGEFDEVEVVEVAVAVGDKVAEGDMLLEVATDKANLEIEAPHAGTIVEVLVEDDAIIPTDQVLMVLER